jgi:hypothetical protein
MEEGRQGHCRPAERRSRPPPYDRHLSDLIGELSTRSDGFVSCGPPPDVQIHRTSVQLICHLVVGDLDLSFESFPLVTDPSQMLLTYTAEPGSPSQYAPASRGPLGRDHRRLRAGRLD